MNLREQSGMTLVELMIAITIAVGLVLASATLYSVGLKSYLKDKIVQDVQRETDAAVNSMSTNLREAVSVNASSNLTVDPHSLVVDIPGGQTRRYYVTASQLHYVNEQGTDVNLSAPGTTVSSLTFTPTATTVEGQTILKSIAVGMTLSRTKFFQTTSQTTNTTIGTRPQ